MPRQARIDAPGALHHIICRGIRTQHFQGQYGSKPVCGTTGRCFTKERPALLCRGVDLQLFQLLLKTGNEPIAGIMRRLLTGYAVTFNQRHHRCGRLFQNRYKSILCQADTYLLELVGVALLWRPTGPSRIWD
jgi:hypothetical protein